MSETFVDTFAIPGSEETLTYEREASGRLVRLSAGGRVHFAEDERGEKTFGENLGHVREVPLQNGLARLVRAAGQSWIEEYAWDEIGRPVRIDGVEIARDGQRRVVSCGDWKYAYAGEDLAVIRTPHGVRHVTRGTDGRPVVSRNGDGPEVIRYDDDGARVDVTPLPSTWHRDPLGRLWTICDGEGRVRTTFLWNGFSCIGRIDGDAAEPLAAFFSLDPSSTPVRVITADGVTRIPRDAFGESLLAHEGVPGLYGGAVHGGFVHFRSRALDPRCGSFDRRDPWHGRDDDPRRAEGFAGPLPVEDPPCGPYAVCQYDPVGRTDPTGEASGFQVGMGFLYTILDATWSLQHNTAGLFGLDWTIAFWFSLLYGIGQAIGGAENQNQLSRFFDYEGLYNDRTGVWGIRRGIFGVKRAFTYQHMVVSEAETFDALNAVSAIVPTAKFEPALYGSMLHVAPEEWPPLLLRGNGDPALAGWSRSGGPAEAIAPGSPVPRFPLGGLHLDHPLEDVRVPLTCDVTELVPAGTPLTGTADEPRVATVIPFSEKLEAGTVVVLTDAADAVDVKTVAEVDDKHATRKKGRRVRFTEPGIHVSTNGVSLRVLSKAEGSDSGRTSPAPKHVDIAEGTVKYKRKDLLRFKQGGDVVGAGFVDGFESQIVLDSGVPAGFAAPLEVRVAVAAGKDTKGKLEGNKLKSTPRPSKGDPIVLAGGGKKVAVIVKSELADDQVELDRSEAELAALGADVTWKDLKSGTKLGSAAALPAGATLSYTPEDIRQAPKSGLVLLRDDSKPAKTVARTVASRNYDALVIRQDLPGDATKPYDVEVFPVKRSDIQNLTLHFDPRIKLSAPGAVSAKALQLVRLPGPAVAAGAIARPATFAGKEATLGGVGDLRPSQYVVLTGAGGGPQANVVVRINASLELDRQIPFTAGDPIDVISLRASGPKYDADAVDATHVVVHATAGGISLQFPRFEKGAIVEAVFGGNTELYVVDAVEGTTLTLKGGPTGAAIAPAAHGTIGLVVPFTPLPSNGTWRAGVNGKPVGGATTNRITADIWDGDHVANGADIALVQNGVAHAAKINASPIFVVHLLAASSVGPAGDVTIPGHPPSTTAVFTQQNDVLTLADVAGPPLLQGPNAIVVIPYGPGLVAQKKMDMSSGTVRVPADAEKFEVDRRKSLVYHELTHTKQAEHFGPLWIGFFPLFALEGLLEGTTDVELPKFSKYVPATIALAGGTLVLTIPDAQGIDFEDGTKVQIEQGGAHLVTLGGKNGDGFAIQGGGGLVAGAVQVRRLTDEGGWGTFRDVVFNIMSGLTLGGVTNYVAGTVWGGFLYGIFQFIHFLGHRLGKAGTEYPAVVVDPRTVRMTSDEGRREVQGYNRVFLLKGGDRSDLLDVERIENDTVTLARATDFTGDITVNPYSSDDPLSTAVVDNLTYFNATVPDPAKPAQVLVQKNGDKELKLKPFDIVSVSAGTISRRTNVTAVADGGIAELEDAPPTFGPDRAVRIAYVDENDPVGSVDSLLLTKMGMGWMRSLFDPWRQIQFGLDPKPGSAADWLARFARYSFSSHSWSAVIPGYLFLDNLFNQPNDGHLARTEQQAGNESGRVYSPQGKIRGGFKDAKGHAEKTAKVGDVARYWLTPRWKAAFQPVIEAGRLDEPGPGMVADLIEVLPEVSPESVGGALNLGARSVSARPGTFVPDAFYRKPGGADPEASTGAMNGMLPGVRGFIPPTPQLEISLGSYVAFTGPGTHRVTVSDDVPSADLARAVHDKKRQTIFFNVTVSDVTVKVGGTVIARKTPLDEVKLLPGQRAVLKVDSEGEWVLTAERPGNVVNVAKDGKSVTMIANTPGTSETLEVSRVYPLAGGKYVDSVLATHGVHLPVPIHVPVRQFKVTVRESFELVAELKAGAAPVPSAKAGQTVFAMLPARIPPGASLTATYQFAPGVTAPDPSPVIEPVAVPAELREVIGEGRIYRIEFPVDDPPEEPVTITFTINMGPDAGVPVSAKLDYAPHFVLTAPAFDVAVSANRDLASAEEIGKAFAITGAPGVKAVVAAGGKSVNVRVAERANGGTRRIMALSKADPMKRALRTITVPAPPAAPVLDAEFDDISVFVSMLVQKGHDLSTGALLEPAGTNATSEITSFEFVADTVAGKIKVLAGQSMLNPLAFPGDPPVRRNAADPAHYDVRLLGRVCYPIVPGVSGVVAGAAPVPVVALLHGQHAIVTSWNGLTPTGGTVTIGGVSVPIVRSSSVVESGNHLGYEYLQRELARNGIASISVDTCVANFRDSLIQTRADMLLGTLDEWRRLADTPGNKYNGRLDFNRVGLAGHSRGGDAVVRAAKDNRTRTVRNPAAPDPRDRYGITALCSLAPTDFTGIFSNAATLTAADALTYLVVYGSLDNDVAGRADGSAGAFASFGGTGFRLYDRATCNKAMVFVSGACHNRFNTNWGLDKNLSPAHPGLIGDAEHQAAAEFYIGGFFRWLLGGEAQLQDRFTRDAAAPAGVTPSLQWSFGDELRPVDTFEQSPDNELGQKRDTASYADVIRFGSLEVNGKAQGPHVPHQTRILDANLLGSVSKPTALVEPVPVADWSVLRFLTFRVGRFFDLEKDPFDGTQPHLRVTLRDEAGKEATVAETEFFTATVPGRPFRKEFGAERLTFHRLETVRIPLAKFKGVDLHRVKRVSFDVDGTDKTHLFLDSLEVVRV